MRKLIAKVPVLLDGTMYEAGSALPTTSGMVEEWVKYGTAEWTEDEAEAPARAKAEPAAAEPGMTGLSSDGDQEAMAGKVPARTPKKKATK